LRVHSKYDLSSFGRKISFHVPAIQWRRDVPCNKTKEKQHLTNELSCTVSEASERFRSSSLNEIRGFADRNMHHCLTAASVFFGSWAQLAVRIGTVSLNFAVPQSAQYWISVTISKLSGRLSVPTLIFSVFVAISFLDSVAYCLTNHNESGDSSVRNSPLPSSQLPAAGFSHELAESKLHPHSLLPTYLDIFSSTPSSSKLFLSLLFPDPG